MRHQLNPDSDDNDGVYMKLVDAEMKDLVQQLQEAMKQAVERQRNVILIVDGLNQIRKQGKLSPVCDLMSFIPLNPS